MEIVKHALKNMPRCTAYVTHENNFRNLAYENCQEGTKKEVQLPLYTLHMRIASEVLYIESCQGCTKKICTYALVKLHIRTVLDVLCMTIVKYLL